MSSQRQKFESGVARVCELRSRDRATTDLINEVWSALRNGIVVARRQEDALDSCSREAMHFCLEFMLERGAQKKSAKGQVKECLRILLARPAWMETVCSERALMSGVQEALSSEEDAEIIAYIAEAEAKAEAAAAVAFAAEDDPLNVTISVDRPPLAVEELVQEAPKPPQPPTIRERLAEGRRVLESFGWVFPIDRVGTRGDEATRGFMLIHDAVTALTTSSGRAAVGGDPTAVLEEFFKHEEWSLVLGFLLGMYTSGIRRSYSLRIRFVVLRLRSLAPAMLELAPWASLPWGDEPMPAEEAEREAGMLEEYKRRKAVEAVDLQLAQELQVEEEMAAKSMDEAAQQLVQGDTALAQKLQSKGHKTPQRQRSLLSLLSPKILSRRAAGA